MILETGDVYMWRDNRLRFRKITEGTKGCTGSEAACILSPQIQDIVFFIYTYLNCVCDEKKLKGGTKT